MTDPLINHTFGEWTVVEQLPSSKYLCICSCGTERIFPKSDILKERSHHCGCKRYDLSSPYHSKRLPDYRGKRFGRLTVIDYLVPSSAPATLSPLPPLSTTPHTAATTTPPPTTGSAGSGEAGGAVGGEAGVGQHKWLCRCDCGKEIYATTYLLRIGNVQSCGCFKAESSRLNVRKARANNTVAFGTDLEKIRKSVTNCEGRGQTGYRGVFLTGNEKKKYRARITFQGTVYDLGCYEEIEEAIAARKEAEEKLYGDFFTWYEKEGKGKREKAVKERNEAVAEEAREFFKDSAKDETREKYTCCS